MFALRASNVSSTDFFLKTLSTPILNENEDYYARIDSLLLRDPSDRAAHLADHRSTLLRQQSPSSVPWSRTTAATDLDNWNTQIGDYGQFIRRTAALNRPIVTLRTGSTVHTGHLAGLLGGRYIDSTILDTVGALINASADHSTLVLPAQTIQLVEAGRPMTIAPALHEAATSIAVFGNRGDHWTLCMGDITTRILYFQDNTT